MRPDTHVEGILAGGLRDILVGADTGGFESFRGELLVLVGDQVAAEGELVDGGTLTAKIENTDLLNIKEISELGCDGQSERCVPWSREHHGCTSTWGTACSYSNGSNGRDDDPCFLTNNKSVSKPSRSHSGPKSIHRGSPFPPSPKSKRATSSELPRLNPSLQALPNRPNHLQTTRTSHPSINEAKRRSVLT